MKYAYIAILIVAIIGVFAFISSKGDGALIESFEDCISAGYPVMESYPRQCRTPEGKTFVEKIEDTPGTHDNLIRVTNPRPNDVVKSPLLVSGEARGYWYFEASFPVKIIDETGKELVIVPAQAKDEWMTEDFVPFGVELVFNSGTAERGTLILQKDNPSGLPEHDDQLEIPIRFK